MKHFLKVVLIFVFLFSSCCNSAGERTVAPAPTSTTTVTPPLPEATPTPFPSYEDYFAQKIEYIDTNSDEPYFSPVGWNVYASTPEASPGLTLAQELVAGDTLGWIPLTLSRSPDGNLYAFWAGSEEGASLYRLYYPSKTLDLIYTISIEELEQYYYTIQSEATAALLFPAKSPEEVIGERVCLMGYTEIASNQEILWGSYDSAFLALFDDIATHKKDHPQYEWDKLGYEDVADIYVETDSGLTRDLCHYCNSVTGEYRVHGDATYGPHDYWWLEGGGTVLLSGPS